MADSAVDDETALTPWRRLPAGWAELRAGLVEAPLEGAEAAALELAVLGGRPDVRGRWWLPDRHAGRRLETLLGSVTGHAHTSTRHRLGGSHAFVTYEVSGHRPWPQHADRAVARELRRLEAGDGWLAGAVEPGALARALWRATVLRTPAVARTPPGLAAWRMPGRPAALAHVAGAALLGVAPGRAERRLDRWRVLIPLPGQGLVRGPDGLAAVLGA